MQVSVLASMQSNDAEVVHVPVLVFDGRHARPFWEFADRYRGAAQAVMLERFRVDVRSGCRWFAGFCRFSHWLTVAVPCGNQFHRETGPEKTEEKIVRAGKAHACDWCGEPILVGERYVRCVQATGARLDVVRLHHECDVAVKLELEDAAPDDFCTFTRSMPRGMDTYAAEQAVLRKAR